MAATTGYDLSKKFNSDSRSVIHEQVQVEGALVFGFILWCAKPGRGEVSPDLLPAMRRDECEQRSRLHASFWQIQEFFEIFIHRYDLAFRIRDHNEIREESRALALHSRFPGRVVQAPGCDIHDGSPQVSEYLL